MKQTLMAVGAIFAAGVVGAEEPKISDWYREPESPAVRQAIETFRDRKLGLMMHFGLYSQVGIVESWPLSDKDAYWARREVERDIAGDGFKRAYFGLNRSFNPVRSRPDAWAKAAADNGFRYVAFTTKHHDGFCLFDTKETDYKSTDPSCPFSANPNADIVRGLFDACRARGLGISAYFSKPDWHHEDFWENRGEGFVTDRNPTYDTKAHPEKWARFRDFTRRQILELVNGYGPFDLLWLDGGWIAPRFGIDLGISQVVAEARKVNPSLIVVDRASYTEHENIVTPEQQVPGEVQEQPWETCMTMADNWGYHYDDVYKSPRTLIHMLVDVVAKGGNLALNVGPMPDGRLPQPALERMREMGAWLKANGEAIYATRAQKPCRSGDWAFTRSKDGARVFAIRLWQEANRDDQVMFLPKAAELGDVKALVHLGTGSRLACVRSENPPIKEFGFAVELPAGFARNPYADAFELIQD